VSLLEYVVDNVVPPKKSVHVGISGLTATCLEGLTVVFGEHWNHPHHTVERLWRHRRPSRIPGLLTQRQVLADQGGSVDQEAAEVGALLGDMILDGRPAAVGAGVRRGTSMTSSDWASGIGRWAFGP
jgi:hypothetical protein